LLFTLMCLLSISGEAQVLYGSLTGNVTDMSGAVIAGAKVEALNTQTGVINNVETDNSGIYRFSTLQPGTYKVTVSAPRFASAVTENVGIVVNNLKRIDASLKPATQTQEVVVTGEAPLLQTDKADVHTDINAAQVSELPTSGTQGRNFQSLLKVIPGAGLATETNSISGNPQRAINTNVNGQSNQSVNTRIDGAQDAYPWLPANVAYVPPADAIEEVNVTTNSFDAEQGMAGGAAVNVQIKSGTNQLHGTGSWFHTDQNFAAHQYFDKPGQLKPRNNQNAFGGTLGGPIVKDKLFFFVDYERTTQRGKAGPVTRSLPTAAMLTGDFRNLPGNPIIYDPLTGTSTGANKTQISCNGQLNVICPDRIDPASAAMATLLSPSVGQEFTTANDLNNFTGTGTALFNRNNADFKVNYVPTQKTTVFARYSYSRTNVYDPPLLGGAGGDATAGGQLGNSPGFIQSVGLGTTHTFTSNLLLDWNFGYTRQHLGATYDLGSAKGLDLLKIPGTNGAGVPGANTLYNGLPAFQLFVTPTGSSTTNFGNPNTGNPFLFRDNQFVSGANLNWTHGRHNVRGGVEWNHAQLNHFQPQGGSFQTARGSFQFSGVASATQGGAAPTWFNSVADFLLGLPSATGKAYQVSTPVALRWSQYAWYLRDQWQVTSKLTLNAGVRWEYYPFGYSDNGQGLRWFNPADGNVYIGGNGNVPQNDGIDTGHGQFLPRVGVNYRLTPSTVIRAGYGMSADPNNWRYFRNAYPAMVISNNVNPNSSLSVPWASLTGTNGTGLGSGSYNVATGIALVAPPDLTSGTVPLPTNVGTTTIPNPFKRGYINSFNFTIEQDFKGFVTQAAYVGSRNIRPLVNMNLNASAPGTGAAGGLISQALGKTYTGNINGLVPFKDTSYDSLQLELSRRFRSSSFHVVYTWSKALDYEDNEELNALAYPYPAYWSKNHGLAGFDRASNLEIYGLLKLPFGKGEPWLTNGIGSKLLGGWQVSPVLSFLSGAPFTVTASANPLNAFGSSQTADRVGNYRRVSGTPLATGGTCTKTDMSCHYFDPSAFAIPTAGVYGNTNRNQFRGPGYVSANLSLSREFAITERVKFQARADASGITNTPHFANPNAAVDGGNFGVITSVLKPGGFFGPDPGNRVIWLGARVTF
jgi:outer membrane receptor protein involved in Fe transport